MAEYVLNRRRLLQFAGAASVVALAGCTDEDDDGNDTDENGEETVLVAPDGNVFEPSQLEISAGTTVTFVWEASGHNIEIDSQPDGSGWEGVGDLQDEGFEAEHTFDVEGTYEYFCGPHQGQGMTGEIVVGDGTDGSADDGDDGTDDSGGGVY